MRQDSVPYLGTHSLPMRNSMKLHITKFIRDRFYVVDATATAILGFTVCALLSGLHCTQGITPSPSFPLSQYNSRSGEFCRSFSGQVTNATGSPIAGALLHGVWAKNTSASLPAGSMESTTTSSPSGHYHIDPPKGCSTSGAKPVVNFVLFAYKKGHLGYRSDVRFSDFRPRKDFVQKNNRIALTPVHSNVDPRQKTKSSEDSLSFRHYLYMRGSDKILFLLRSSGLDNLVAFLDSRQSATALNKGGSPSLFGSTSPVSRFISTQLVQLFSQDILPSVSGLGSSLDSGLDSGSPKDGVSSSDATTNPSASTTDTNQDSYLRSRLGDRPDDAGYASILYKLGNREKTYDIAARLWVTDSPATAMAQFHRLRDRLQLDGVQIVAEQQDSLLVTSGEFHGAAFYLASQNLVGLVQCGNKACTEPSAASSIATKWKTKIQNQQTKQGNL